MPKTRTFIAVELPLRVRQRAAELIEQLRSSSARVSWVVPENMHITLKFLGDQSDKELAVVCRAVTQAVQDLAPFEFLCRGAGAFPNIRFPRTVWLGVHDTSNSLDYLHGCVDTALSRHGYEPERRAFHPHLTLGRVRSGGPAVEALGRRLAEMVDWDGGPVRTESIVVFSSVLQPGATRYEVLARAPFGGRAGASAP